MKLFLMQIIYQQYVRCSCNTAKYPIASYYQRKELLYEKTPTIS